MNDVEVVECGDELTRLFHGTCSGVRFVNCSDIVMYCYSPLNPNGSPYLGQFWRAIEGDSETELPRYPECQLREQDEQYQDEYVDDKEGDDPLRNRPHGNLRDGRRGE